MVTFTERAAEQLRKLFEQKGGDKSLYIFVESGGCTGLNYGMELVDADEMDEVVEGDLRIRIDPLSLIYLDGSEIDYQEALIGGGFVINNPNATRTCGCGQSFRTATAKGQPQRC